MQGVVWYPVDLADRKVGSFKDVLSVELFSAYAFKTKGKTHQMVKKKDAGNAAANEVCHQIINHPPPTTTTTTTTHCSPSTRRSAFMWTWLTRRRSSPSCS